MQPQQVYNTSVNTLVVHGQRMIGLFLRTVIAGASRNCKKKLAFLEKGWRGGRLHVLYPPPGIQFFKGRAIPQKWTTRDFSSNTEHKLGSRTPECRNAWNATLFQRISIHRSTSPLPPKPIKNSSANGDLKRPGDGHTWERLWAEGNMETEERADETAAWQRSASSSRCWSYQWLDHKLTDIAIIWFVLFSVQYGFGKLNNLENVIY